MTRRSLQIVRLAMLGPLRIDGVGLRPRTRSVLTVLAVRRGEVVTSDQLADAVWNGSPPASWGKQIQICVWDLRRSLGADLIETVNGGYRIVTDQSTLDVDDFEVLIERAKVLTATGEHERAASTYQSALALWRGRPFPDVEDWSPAQAEIARLEELMRTAQEEYLAARLAVGEHRDVAASAEGLVAAEQLRERRWAILALAQYRCGNQADALRTLRRARQTLVEEVGVDPGAELVALEDAMLRQDPGLDVANATSVSARCPYKGLAPYEADDEGAFFGRDAESAACVQRLATTPLLALTGPSGCGKSSLARAGIVPLLRRQHAAGVIVLVPGADPDGGLTSALAGVPGDPILVIDQVEELFVGDHPIETIQAFAARIATYATERAPVILTIRADHLGNLAGEPALARLVESGLYLVAPLSPDALRTTIEGPATAAGLRLEPGLIELLIRDTEGEPGALPLLSHALAETWTRREGRVLTVEGYRATGGIRGAVAQSAEHLYQSLSTEQQHLVHGLVLRLVAPSPDGEPIRVHVDPGRLDGAARKRVLDLLVRARLVTADDVSVQLAHESLTRAWPRLRSWLEADVSGQRIVRHLEAAAAEWDSRGRPDSELYRGERLVAALDWRESTSPDLSEVETAFLDASEAATGAERRALAAHARRQTVQNRRLRWALVATAIFLVAALVVGVVAVGQRREAVAQRRDAALSALVGNAMNLRSNRRDLAALLAVAAYRIGPSAATEAALFSTFTASPGISRAVHTGLRQSTTVGNAAYLTDGETIAFGDEFGAIHLLAPSGDMTELPALSDDIGWPLLDVAAGGRFIAAAWRPNYEPESGVVTVWDLETRTQRFAPVSTDFRIGTIALSEDGSHLAVSGGEAGNVLLLDARDGHLRHDIERLPRPASAQNQVVTAAVAFGLNGALVIGSQAGPVRIVDPSTGIESMRIDMREGVSGTAIDVSADGTTAVVTGFGMALIDLVDGEVIWDRPDGSESCNAWLLAEAIGAILCGEWSGRVIAFDLETGVKLGQRFDSQLGDICALAVSPQGDRFVELAACQGDDLTAVEWRLDGGGPVSRLVGQSGGSGWAGEFTTHGMIAETSTGSGEDFRSNLVDPDDGSVVATFPSGVHPIAPTADGDLVAIFDDGESPPTIGRVNAAGDPIGEPVDPEVGLDVVGIDGSRVVVAGEMPDKSNRLRVIDVGSGEIVMRIDRPDTTWFLGATFGGESIYTAVVDITSGRDALTIQRFDITSGEVVAESAEGYRTVAVNRAGTVVIAATLDGLLHELDPLTLEPVGVPFPGTNGPVGMMALDDAGERLLVRADDETVRFYDVATRTPLGEPIEVGQVDGGASLSSDGTLAAIGTGNGVVVWDLDPTQWSAAACALAGRDLTAAEWDRYIGDLAPQTPLCSGAAGEL